MKIKSNLKIVIVTFVICSICMSIYRFFMVDVYSLQTIRKCEVTPTYFVVQDKYIDKNNNKVTVLKNTENGDIIKNYSDRIYFVTEEPNYYVFMVRKRYYNPKTNETLEIKYDFDNDNIFKGKYKDFIKGETDGGTEGNKWKY